MDDNALYRRFTLEMGRALSENEKINGLSQKELLNELFRTERLFRKTLLSTEHGAKTYNKFMLFILDDQKNKLKIRPYFREAQDTFSNKMFAVLKERNSVGLHRFRINHLFAKWTVAHYIGPKKQELQDIYSEIIRLRTLLCENNLPFAIHNAKKFWSKTPKLHLDYMDLIQDANRGLLEAIDNYVPHYRTVFRSVAIGRMKLNMSEDYSDTLIKLPPKARRILYRTRKAKLKNEDISKSDLKSFVNESFKDVTAADIDLIDSAANHLVRLDRKPTEGHSWSELIADPAAMEEVLEKQQLETKMLLILKTLDFLGLKIIIMKHGELDGIL